MRTIKIPTLLPFCWLLGCGSGDGVALQPIESSASLAPTTETETDTDTGAPSTTDTGTEVEPAQLLSASIELDPDCAVCATAHIELDKPAAIQLALGLDEESIQPWVRSEETANHTIPLLGLRGDTTYQVDIHIDAQAASRTQFTTDSLPNMFPRILLNKAGDDRMQPGLTLINVLEWVNPAGRRFFVLAIDDAGEIVWYKRIERLALALSVDAQGRIYTTNGTLEVLRLDPYGQNSTTWPVDSLGVSSVHHEVRATADGGMALLSTELEAIDGWFMPPTMEEVTFNVVGDRFAVFDAEGNQTWSWSMLDHVDPLEHHTADFHMNFWEMPPYLEVDAPKDWSHANTLIPSGDNWLTSLRNLDWLMEINPETDEIEWIFGPGGDFGLAEGSRWFSRQHSPSILRNGNVLLYDNGLHRADATDDEEAYSRVVEYALDRETMTASEVWSWDGGEPYICTIAGSVSRLPNGNHLINDGAIHGGVKWMSDRWQPHYSARIREIAGTEDPELLWELVVGHPDNINRKSWFVYRAERIESLYPPHARPE